MILVAYNTGPTGLAAEDEAALAQMQEVSKKLPVGITFHALHVEESTSKSQNMNAAVQWINSRETEQSSPVTSEVSNDVCVAFFDADHWPLNDCVRRAANLLASVDAAAVVGTLRVRTPDTTFISVETDMRYIYDHPVWGRFGGNGYWRLSVLLDMEEFTTDYLLEDIMCSIRTYLGGRRIVYNHTLEHSEEAPQNWGSFWQQRLRWIQGYVELIDMTVPVLKSQCLKWWQKWVILWYGVYNPTVQSFILILCPFILMMACWEYELVLTEFFSCILLAVEAILMAFTVILPPLLLRFLAPHPLLGIKDYMLFVLQYSFFRLLHLGLSLQGMARVCLRMRKWVVTSRGRNHKLEDSKLTKALQTKSTSSKS